jgi:hypothetical protein
MDWPHGFPVKDAFLRASRPVCELYSQALATLDVQGYRSMLRLRPWFPEEEDPNRYQIDPQEVQVWVLPEKPWEGPGELGTIRGTSAVATLTATGRAALVLEAIHACVLQLAGYRGWDVAQFQGCYDHVLAHDFEYRYESPWKSSPDRRSQARAVYTLTPHDGFGRVTLEVAERSGDASVRSGEAIAFCTSQGFARSAKTLRWTGSSQVALTPYIALGPASGLLAATLDDSEWTFEVRDDVSVRPPVGAVNNDLKAPQQLPRVVAVRM